MIDPALYDSCLVMDEDQQAKAARLADFLVRSNCTECALGRGDHARLRDGLPPVPGRGKGRIMFVGHTIGKAEADNTEPAIGEASRPGFSLFLDALFPGHKIRPDESRDACLEFVYMTNHTRCGPEETPTAKQSRVCSTTWLAQEMAIVDPVLVVFWNKATAAHALGVPSSSLELGRVHTAALYGKERNVVVMTHPAAIQRDPKNIKAVETAYRLIGDWLIEQGYVDGELSQYPKAEHLWVDDPRALALMIEDLWDCEEIAIDTETSYTAPGRPTEWEKRRGGLLWTHEGHELITVQLAGARAGGDVERTYTVDVGFRHFQTKERYTKLRTADVIDALGRLLEHAPVTDDGEVYRQVYLWNDEFDSAVLTRNGLDLMGWTHTGFPIEMYDGPTLRFQVNEHLGSIKGAMGLDAAAKEFMGESKGSFGTYFDDPSLFATLDVSSPTVRERVLGYTGEDPRKTLYCGRAVLAELHAHARSIRKYTDTSTSSCPTYSPPNRPPVATGQYDARLVDVSYPIDANTVPILGRMAMTGFELKDSDYPEMETFVYDTLQAYLRKLASLGFSHVNPASAEHRKALVLEAFDRLTARAAAVYQHAVTTGRQTVVEDIEEALGYSAGQAVRLVEGFGDGQNRLGPTECTVEAYASVYGAFNAQEDTIFDKVLVYFRSAEDTLTTLARMSLADEALWQNAIDTALLEEVMRLCYDHNAVWKRWSTYFLRFQKEADRLGLFHPWFIVWRATSARLTSNFQNVPRGADEDDDLALSIARVRGEHVPDDDPEEVARLVAKYRRLDIRERLFIPQADALNTMFSRMNLQSHNTPWRVTDEPYVGVFADYAAMEDVMAYAQTADPTKAFLRTQTGIDAHFFNAAFAALPTGSTTDDVLAKYEELSHQQAIQDAVEELKSSEGAEAERVRRVYAALKAEVSANKDAYRTPMKTVHYAKQYGVGDRKLHALLVPIKAAQGVRWTMGDTIRLSKAYDEELYPGITAFRESTLKNLEIVPYVDYAVFGQVRHAKQDHRGNLFGNEGLSVVNATNQGFCAYIAKLAMLRIDECIRLNADRWDTTYIGGPNYVGICLQVHDEIGVVAPAHLAKEVATVIEDGMRMAVAPGSPGDAAYWGDNGYLVLPDQSIKAEAFFEADAEVKRTIAKTTVLADGTLNVLGDTSRPETMAQFESNIPHHKAALVTCHAGSGYDPF